MTTTEAWTIGELLKWTADFLRQKGSASPRLDAEVLLAEACSCERIALYTRFNDPAPEEIRTAFRELVRRRAEGTPVAYLVGRREFYSLQFQVTPDVLIPRPETEHVVITALDLVKKMPAPGRPWRIADVGTGSGILAVCLARYLPNSRVTAIDLSPTALAVAETNVRRHELADRVQLVEGDLLGGFPPEPCFDLIVSNPPYLSRKELGEAAPDVRDHEPHLALVAGDTGGEVIERLLPQALQRLHVGGSLVMEISPPIEQAVRAFFSLDDRWRLEPTVKDLAGLPRVIRARRDA